MAKLNFSSDDERDAKLKDHQSDSVYLPDEIIHNLRPELQKPRFPSNVF